MTIFKKAVIASICVLLGAGTALAQDSTPLPKRDEAFSVMLPGTFSELEGEHVIGDKTAPVTMIIYASVMCSHCAHWFQDVWPKIKKDFVETGKVRVVFREFPTAPGALAFAGFQIANCAPDDKYFSLIEHQMSEQDNIFKAYEAGKALDSYLAIAKLAGLKDEAEMNACFANEEGRKKINNSMELAKSGGIDSVPSFMIGGEEYEGSPNYLPLNKHLDSLVKRGFSPMPKQ